MDNAFIDIVEAQAALVRSEQRLKEAQRIAQLGSWEVLHGPSTVQWSDEMFRIYGVDPAGGPPSTDHCLATVHPEDRSLTANAFAQAIMNGAPFEFTHRVIVAGGAVKHVCVRGQIELGEGGVALRSVGTAQDITVRVDQQMALVAKEENLRCITTAMAEGVVLHARDGRIIDANPAAETILGLTRDQLLGKTSLDPDWQSCREDGTPYPGSEHPAMQCLRTGKTLRGQIMGIRAPSRGLRWVSINSQPVFGGDPREPFAVVATFVDVTEERRLASELRDSYERIRELAQRLEHVREEERRSLSRTLHEGIAQDLFAIKLGLSNLLTQARGRAGVTAVYEEMSGVLAKCMVDTRRLANDLWPSALSNSTVAVAIENHARYFGELSGLSIRVSEIAPFPAIDEATRLLFFRAAQEALTNVARHAGARTVEIVLRADARKIYLDVSDDGVGICDAALTRHGSLGLLGIRERFAACRGGLEVRRNDARGTILSVYLQIPTAAAARATKKRKCARATANP